MQKEAPRPSTCCFSIIFTGFLPHGARQRLSTSHNVPLQAAGKGHTALHERPSRRCMYVGTPLAGRSRARPRSRFSRRPSAQLHISSCVSRKRPETGTRGNNLSSKWARTNHPGDGRAHMTTTRSTTPPLSSARTPPHRTGVCRKEVQTRANQEAESGWQARFGLASARSSVNSVSLEGAFFSVQHPASVARRTLVLTFSNTLSMWLLKGSLVSYKNNSVRSGYSFPSILLW